MKSNIKFKELDLNVKGMGSPKVWGLINHLSGRGDVYLEVGVYQGASLIAAAQGNDTRCIGIDNFKQFNRDGDNEKICRKNISPYKNIELIKGDGLKELRKLKTQKLKVDTFFYDGTHEKDAMTDAFKIAVPMINEGGYIIIDDTNWKEIANWIADFCEKSVWEVIFSRKAKFQGDAEGWWNGVQVLKRKGE